MGLYDRSYTQDNYGGGGYGGMRIGFPTLTPIVKWLLIANVAVYLSTALIPPIGMLFYSLFPVDTTSWLKIPQIWRLLTYQFMHDTQGIGHIFFNMLMLYMLGPTLERHYGSKRFCYFYLGCGVAGGVLYILLSWIGWLSKSVLVGASGSLLGVMTACAILFPHIRFYVFGIFPVPIRILAFIAVFFACMTILQRGINDGGEAAHLGGVIAGAAYVFSGNWRERIVGDIQQGRWERKKAEERRMEQTLDEILDKVNREGLHSLTHKEKQLLKQATEAERQRKQH